MNRQQKAATNSELVAAQKDKTRAHHIMLDRIGRICFTYWLVMLIIKGVWL